MTQQIELKDCPFCGGKAERIDIEDGENAGGSCICCTACQASSNVEFDRKENFVANWNRRAAAPAFPAYDEMLEAMKGIEHFSDALNYRNDHLSKALRQWIDAGRAVIAKAEAQS